MKRFVAMLIALSALSAMPALAQGPTARDAQPSDQINQPVKPPQGLEAPGDLRNPEEPTKSRPSEANRTDPANVSRGTGTTIPSRECEGCKRVQARVLGVQDNTLTVRDRSKQEIKLTMDRETIKGQENPKYGGYMEGDRIEAYVKPDGKVHSITLLRMPAGRPGPEDLGD
jgi:hypothetical protein